MQPSRDQGRRGTCAAFTGSAIKEIHERDEGFNEWMSPEFIYYHRENKPATGMYGRNVFQILQKIGSVPESKYPYRNDENAPAPDKELYETATKYRIANYAKVTTVNGLKRALLELGPCYLQLPLYSSRPHFWRANGEKSAGGHALTVIGFNKTGFILKNSWGPTWNGDGCIIFPYNEWDLLWECWVPVDEKTSVGQLIGSLSSDPKSLDASTPRLIRDTPKVTNNTSKNSKSTSRNSKSSKNTNQDDSLSKKGKSKSCTLF
jgi:hypothetical protein